MEKPEDF